MHSYWLWLLCNQIELVMVSSHFSRTKSFPKLFLTDYVHTSIGPLHFRGHLLIIGPLHCRENLLITSYVYTNIDRIMWDLPEHFTPMIKVVQFVLSSKKKITMIALVIILFSNSTLQLLHFLILQVLLILKIKIKRKRKKG